MGIPVITIQLTVGELVGVVDAEVDVPLIGIIKDVQRIILVGIPPSIPDGNKKSAWEVL